MKKRLLSLMLAACMMFSSMSMGVSADGNVGNEPVNIGEDIIQDDSKWQYEKYGGYGDYITITGYDGTLSGEVVIPSQIDGKPVYRLNGVLHDQSLITKVVISEGISYISMYDFYGCANLTEIHLPESLTEFKSLDAYSYCCPNLERFVYAGSQAQFSILWSEEDYKTWKSLEDELFSYEKEMTYTWLCDSKGNIICYDGIIDGEITVPATVDGQAVYGLYASALNHQRGLTKLTVENGIRYVNLIGATGCSNLHELNLPFSLYTFYYGCDYVTVINFDGSEKRWNRICGNPNDIPEYMTINFSDTYHWITGDAFDYTPGFLITADGTLPSEVTVPAEIDGAKVYTVDRNAFRDQSGVETITFEDGITAIYDCFYGCGALTTVNLPASINALLHTFEGCESLKTINFAGTQAQWDAINKQGNIPPEGVTVNILGGSSQPHVHSYKSELLREATCVQEGIMKYTCDCGDQYTEVIEKLMHSEYVVSGKEPTATSPGLTEGKVCAVCGEITQPQQEIPPIGAVAHGTHGNLTWVLTDDGELIISGEGDMAVAPDYLYPWLEIGYVSQIKKLTIAEGITSIARGAFDSCRALEEVTLPGSLTLIDTFAFDRCDRLTDVYYGGSAAEWRKVQIEWYNTPLTSAQLYIGGKAVVDQGTHGDNLTWVLHPDGELVISGEGAMKENGIVAFPWRVSHEDDITKVTIGDGVTSIAESAFSGCKNVESVEIPDSLTSIGMSAFMNCMNLKSIEIPETVTYIGNASFYGCSSLESINIPKGVTEIPYNTFCYCSGLKDVYYGGSEAAWNAVVIDERDNGNDYLLKATMHFAVEEEITVGNINGDGAIDSSDVNLLYRSVMDYEELAAEQQAAADVNSDGKFNSADVNLLYRYVMGYAELQ